MQNHPLRLDRHKYPFFRSNRLKLILSLREQQLSQTVMINMHDSKNMTENLLRGSTRLNLADCLWFVAVKCHCAHKIGSSDYNRNGIICEQNGIFLRNTSCADDEWCVGPTNSTDSRYQVDSLCVKGKSRRRCLKAVLSYLLKFKTNIFTD